MEFYGFLCARPRSARGGKDGEVIAESEQSIPITYICSEPVTKTNYVQGLVWGEAASKAPFQTESQRGAAEAASVRGRATVGLWRGL